MSKTLQELEKMKSPIMHYLAAWEEEKKIIWYEFISSKLCHLLKCYAAEAAKTFRDAVIFHLIPIVRIQFVASISGLHAWPSILCEDSV